MIHPLFLPLSSFAGISFFIRWLGHYFVLIAFVAYQFLFPQFITPTIAFSIYSICTLIFLIDFLVLFFHETNTKRIFSKYLFIIDSFFLFALVFFLGIGGIYLFLFLAFFQILAFGFYQNRLALTQFTLWVSLLFSLGFFCKEELSSAEKEMVFVVSNLSLIFSFILGNALISFLKTNVLNQKIISFHPSFYKQKVSPSLLVAVRLSNRLKPAFNSLLNLFDSFLSDKEGLSKKQEDISYQIKQINKLQHLMQKLDQLEKMEISSLQPFNLNELIQKTIQNLLPHPERPSFLKETLELHSEGFAKGSSSHLEQAFREILINSFQSLKKSENPEIRIKTYNKDNKIFFEVFDNGLGAERGDMPYLAEPLFSKRLGQSGLGLSFVLKIIEAHRGILKFDNAPSGFKVSIALPLLPIKNPSEKRLTA